MSKATSETRDFYMKLIPSKYTGLPPMPHPACEAPTPDEQVRIANEERQKEIAQRQHMYDEQQKDGFKGYEQDNTTASKQFLRGASDIFGKVKSVAAQAVLQIEKGAADATLATKTQLRQFKLQAANERFSQHFPELAHAGEVLLADYECSVIHDGIRLNGHLQITRRYLCFCSQSSLIQQAGSFLDEVKASIVDTQVKQDSKCIGLKESIPLTQIASIRRSVTLETNNAKSPYIMCTPNDSIIMTAIQVYTISNKCVYQFLDFNSIIDKASGALATVAANTAIERAYNYLDHAWRSAVKVPIDGMEYD